MASKKSKPAPKAAKPKAAKAPRVEARIEGDQVAGWTERPEPKPLPHPSVPKPAPKAPKPRENSCLCGCGTPCVAAFAAGHDSRVKGEIIKRCFGTIEAMMKWAEGKGRVCDEQGRPLKGAR